MWSYATRISDSSALGIASAADFPRWWWDAEAAPEMIDGDPGLEGYRMSFESEDSRLYEN